VVARRNSVWSCRLERGKRHHDEGQELERLKGKEGKEQIQGLSKSRRATSRSKKYSMSSVRRVSLALRDK
jgi:hypothetical protein